jgi:hypothetical protein
MKNIISLVVLVSSISFAQIVQSKSLIELKQLSAISSQLSAVNSRQLAVGSQQLTISNHHPSSIIHHSSSIIQYQVSDTQRKSPALAILYSILLPGMGELYAGDYSSGKYFTIADGV